MQQPMKADTVGKGKEKLLTCQNLIRANLAQQNIYFAAFEPYLFMRSLKRMLQLTRLHSELISDIYGEGRES